MTKAYQSGILVGIFAGLFFIALHRFIKYKKKKTCLYDERQILTRGKGFQYGFFTLMFYDLIFNATYINGTKWCDNLTGNMIGIMLSLCVFAIYCIWNDAYLSLNEKPKLIYFTLGILTLSNLLIGIFALISGRLIQSGRVNLPIINLMLAIETLFLLITFFLKNRLNHKQSEQEQK